MLLPLAVLCLFLPYKGFMPGLRRAQGHASVFVLAAKSLSKCPSGHLDVWLSQVPPLLQGIWCIVAIPLTILLAYPIYCVACWAFVSPPWVAPLPCWLFLAVVLYLFVPWLARNPA